MTFWSYISTVYTSKPLSSSMYGILDSEVPFALCWCFLLGVQPMFYGPSEKEHTVSWPDTGPKSLINITSLHHSELLTTVSLPLISPRDLSIKDNMSEKFDK